MQHYAAGELKDESVNRLEHTKLTQWSKNTLCIEHFCFSGLRHLFMLQDICSESNHHVQHHLDTHFERVLEGAGLVLCILGNVSVGSTAVTLPDLVASLIDIVIRTLLALGTHLNCVLRVSFNKRLG